MKRLPYQVMPDLSPEQYDALKASIELDGVKIPIEKDENGEVLDGHNRVQICSELGIKNYPIIVRAGLSEDEKKAHARSVNLNRRHLTKPARDALINDQLKDTPKISDRAIAAMLGVDHKTVGTRRKKLVSCGEIPHVEERLDTLGRKQKAPAPVYVDNTPEGRAASVSRAKEIKSQNSHATQLGTKTASNEERGDNLYETPEVATYSLLQLEAFSNVILEPSCGRGAISRVLEDAGYETALSDLNDYGTKNHNGRPQAIGDFIGSDTHNNDWDIVTNPPYGDVMNAYIAHAVRMMAEGNHVSKIAMLLNINVLCGTDDADREYYMSDVKPSKIYVFKRRLPMMHRDGWDGPKASSSMNTGWFIWEKGFEGETQIIRVDWAKLLGVDHLLINKGASIEEAKIG